MVLLLATACQLLRPSVDIQDRGCACIEADKDGIGNPIEVHVACLDCVDPASLQFECTVVQDEQRVVVSASASVKTTSCAASDSCQALVGTCPDRPTLPKGDWLLVYGQAEMPFSTPLATKPVCACPGSMKTPR